MTDLRAKEAAAGKIRIVSIGGFCAFLKIRTARLHTSTESTGRILLHEKIKNTPLQTGKRLL